MQVRSRPENIRRGSGLSASHMFRIGWWFFILSALLGVLLRMQVVHPLPGFNYGNFLHGHSHIAFLGWVFNAFFALACFLLVRVEDRSWFQRLFLLTQIPVAGMLISYPLQGYGAVSITFSTLHMVCTAFFAWKLWWRHRASPVAASYLRAALVCLVVSGAGPVALGPLAVLGMHDSPWYALSIYFYLHFQYNGWFVFFILAILLRQQETPDASGPQPRADAASRALPWLIAGFLLTFTQSTLWLEPPAWVFLLAAAGAAAQLIGFGKFLHALGLPARLFQTPSHPVVHGLVILALASLTLKYLLQLLSAWPILLPLVNQHYMVIAFLHLVFLGVVTPMLLSWALELKWVRIDFLTLSGLAFFLCGALLTQLALVYPPLGALLGWPAWPRLPETLLAAAIFMLLGLTILGIAPPDPAPHSDEEKLTSS